jgi:HlyD family secretion protein
VKRLPRRLPFILGFLMLFVVAGVAARARFKPKPTPPPRLTSRRRGDVTIKVSDNGVVEPLTKVEVKSKVGGRVQQLLAEEGQLVKAGQLLAIIDPTELRSQADQTRAQYDAAQARLAQASTEAGYQTSSTSVEITSAQRGVEAARARLEIARRHARTQPELTRSAIEQARATLEQAKANLRMVKNSTQPQNMEQAKADYDRAVAQATTAGKQKERYEKLLAQGYISASQADQARADADVAEATRRAAEIRLRTMQQSQFPTEVFEAQTRVQQAEAALNRALADRVQLQLRQDDIRAAEAAYQQAQEQLHQARLGRARDTMRGQEIVAAQAQVRQISNQLAEMMVRLNDTRIVAPMSGIVTKRYLEPGEMVMSAIASFGSGNPIFQIANLDRMRIRVNINEVDVAKVRVRAPVEIRTDAERGRIYNGVVEAVAPASTATGQEAQQGNGGGGGGGQLVKFAVKITVTAPGATLRPGMTAAVDIISARAKNVVRVPLEALPDTLSSTNVTVKRGKTDVKAPVKIGLRSTNFAEVISGLQPGDKVLPAKYQGPRRKEFRMEMGP